MQKKRKKELTLHASFRRFRDLLVSLVPMLGMAVYLYGLRPLIMTALAATTSMLCDMLTAALRRKRYDPTDLTSLTFSVLLVMMLPASASYVIVVFGAVVTVMLGKHVFGGTGNYPFHPAAFGFAFVAICRPDQVFKYPKAFSEIGLGIYSRAVTYDAPAAALKLGGIPAVDRMDLLIGQYPGPLGATFCLVLAAVLMLLVSHGTITWHIPGAYLLAVSLYAYAFPRVNTTRAESVMFELLAGVMVYSAIYIVSEPYTSPSNPNAKLIYGFAIGIATMLFNHFGSYQVGSCFAVLLLSPLSSWLDRRFGFRDIPNTKEANEDEI